MGAVAQICYRPSARKAHVRRVRSSVGVNEVGIHEPPLKSPTVKGQDITFLEEDAKGIQQPHDDPLVVTMVVANYAIHRVLIDNGSSADLLFIDAFDKMCIGKERLRPTKSPLVGFSGEKVFPLDVVTLPLTAGTSPKQVTVMVDFLVVDCPSTYNIILGRTTLNAMRAVTLTYHLLMRFPTEQGIGELRGDQATARECYAAALRTKKLQEALAIEKPEGLTEKELNQRAEPVEDLIEIDLDEERAGRKVSIGLLLNPLIRDSLVQLLRDNKDVFAWAHDDMPGINPSIVQHRLNVDPSFKPVRQKSKWRLCVDFTDLNEACPKDSFLLPMIDMLVEGTARHELLNFMDTYSGYNQSPMYAPNSEKTSFITDRGLYCYKVMPFRKNASATYQRLVNTMFKQQIGRNMEVYVDDMLVKSLKAKNHLADLQESFDVLRAHNMRLNPTKCAFGVYSKKILGYMVSQRGIEANPEKIQILKKAFEWTPECEQAFIGLKNYLNSPPLLSRAISGESLYLYLAVSPAAVSSALVREENTRKLRPYFQAHTIIVLTDQPLRQVLYKPETSGCLTKWSVELGEFDIQYKPRVAIKGQALADFVVEFSSSLEDNGVTAVAEINPENQMHLDDVWSLYVDGSSNARACGAGLVIISPEGENLKYALRFGFRATNNEAEYEALIAGLKLTEALGVQQLKVFTDSQLIVGQVCEEYEAKDDKMKLYLHKVRCLIGRFKKFTITQIPRNENENTVALARLATAEELESTKAIPLEYLEEPSISKEHKEANQLAPG
ncbi:uncharacterized protein LOC132288728 [Cornus florida]|uniref:uncharacterized protein LOC132288728 n=1 Tax=Cornus florida TaxID=4283 RepID=UPI00289D04E2|nr:uncharacterized protein LOC132288728 [Cornus florida]